MACNSAGPPPDYALAFRLRLDEFRQLYRRLVEATVGAGPAAGDSALDATAPSERSRRGRDEAANSEYLVPGGRTPLDDEDRADFRRSIAELERALVVKVFVEIAQTDWHWSAEERRLAMLMCEHFWPRQFDPAEGRAVLEGLVDQAGRMSWTILTRPFYKLPAFKAAAPELQSRVRELARVVAECDGPLTPNEQQRLRHVQLELDRQLTAVPIDDEPPAGVQTGTLAAPHAAAGTKTAAAIQQLAAQRLEPAPAERAAEAEKSRPQRLAEALADLDKLTGLAAIKSEVQELVNFLKIEEERADLGLPRTPISLHMVFSGNPGTGKTSVARIVGRIFGALGVLVKGHLVETDRSGLVAEYAGQTGPKTNRRIDEALDGVLFIDEAYSLVADGGDDPYGVEALQTLLKRMEDDRKRLVVILAGYTEPMDRLLRANPGLESRFGRRLHFCDYSSIELGRIFERLAAEQCYRLAPATRLKLLLCLQYLVEHRDQRFGNGRLVRNLFEQAIRRLANRVVLLAQRPRDVLSTLEPDDVAIGAVPEAVWNVADVAKLRLAIVCPGCRQVARFGPRHLGRAVKCVRCGESFRADWAEAERLEAT